MLNNASGFRKVYIAAGYTDLRRGIDGLASIVKFNFQLDPYEKDILFLFCGRRSDRIKGLVANSHFLRTAGPHFPDSQGHIKRTVRGNSRAGVSRPC